MPDRDSQTSSVNTAKLIAAALIAIGIWEFLTAIIGDVLVPWVGELLGQNPALPLSFTKNYDYADLAVSAFELIAAAIVAAIIHYLFSPSRPNGRAVPALDLRETALVPVAPPITANPEPRREEAVAPVFEPPAPPRKIETVLTPEPKITPPEPSPKTNWSPAPAPSPAPIPPVPTRQPVISPHENVRVEPPRPVEPSKPITPAKPVVAAPLPEPKAAPANPFWVPPPTEPKPPAAPVIKATAEAKPEPPKKKKKEKEKQVYYNLVGEPIMDDEE